MIRHPPTVYTLTDTVSLDGYTRLLPSSSYHYYEDRSVAIFYADDSREEELLRCEIAARLGSSDPEKLVYRNEKYLAVFEEISDYHHPAASPASSPASDFASGPASDPASSLASDFAYSPAFVTGRHTLYARP